MPTNKIEKTKPRISAIMAMSRNRVIGKGGQLPWRLPEDLKRFKALTTGHAVIMGRKTYESIGKLLPQRKNIILTRQKDYRVEGAWVVSTFEEALACGASTSAHVAASTGVSTSDNAGVSTDAIVNANEIFVIGGEEIYRIALAQISRIYLTWIEADIEGDAFFPEFDRSDFQEMSREDRQEPLPHSYLTLDRIRF